MDALKKALAVKRKMIHPERQNFCLNKLSEFSKRLILGIQDTPYILLPDQKQTYSIDLNLKQCRKAKRDGLQNVIRASWSNLPFRNKSEFDIIYADNFGDRKDINEIAHEVNRLKTKKLIVLGAARAFRKPAKCKWKYLLKTRFPKLKLQELRKDGGYCSTVQWTAILYKR